MSSVAAIEADVGATGTGDRWFWLRGTFGAVGLLTLLWGQLVVPKFVALFQELDFTDLPFPLLLTAWVDRTVGGIAGSILLDLALLGCAILAAVPSKPGTWRTVKWVVVICLICLGALSALGLYSSLLAMAQLSSSLSA